MFVFHIYNSFATKLHCRDQGDFYLLETMILFKSGKIIINQVAQWATIAHLGTSIMFGDTLIYDAQRQVTLNLKQ